MNQNEQYLDTYANGTIQEYSAAELAERRARAERPEKKTGRPNAFVRGLMWAFGIIVGATVLFGCLIFWVWGLDYLGVIDYNNQSNPGKNEFNQDSGGYSEFEDFYDYFNDYFGENGGVIIPPNGGSGSAPANPQSGTPGIGVTIQELPQLDFAIDDTYTAGLVVVEINPKGALVGTDVQVGDLIVAANGSPCPSIDALDLELKATGVGGEMTLTVARFVAGVATTHEVTITLVDISELS